MSLPWAVSRKRLTTKQHEKLTVKVLISGGATIANLRVTGRVRIYNGSKLLKTVTLDGGRASVTLGLLTRGTHKLHVVYAGSAEITTSSSPTVTVKVNR
jgi:hypothetical protein